ncbi:GYDIA family GHMP kinase [Seonamhaeicola maritimus]|uniref:GHMP kinase n=1 Tax=Seonamhaeicola maritimus TaxID=2591822 RepID=A0A5C7GK24_9FLAO|nr:GYDIA family GHMP kinase [Seonamhaeicola maritimus]TXG38565.1 GHMP kinase [Seonamhaeicola maritimus]
MQKFYSNGKLLLSGEYVVLDGANSLAIPTKYGQSLTVEPIDEPIISWKSLDEKGIEWFNGTFKFSDSEKLKSMQDDNTTIRLLQILKAAKQLNPNFLNSNSGYNITTVLDFPRNWGLGTSSTLINNIAQWAKINAFKLLELTFGGSGYDIACAQNNNPISYQILNNKVFINLQEFNPEFKEHLYFVHLNKKQNSREGIAHYRAQDKENVKTVISEINTLTSKMIHCDSLDEFESLINQHEFLIAKITNQTPVKGLLFNDFNGSIKSLGAWGGDFVLATSKAHSINYFINKGYKTIIPYTEMVL